MRNASTLVVLLTVALPACGSGDGTTVSGKHATNTRTSSAGTPTESGVFTPPPKPEGFTRFEAATIANIQPGDDTTHCQYVMAPVDHDVDILDVQGSQSKFGHHAVAFSYVPADGDEVGTEIKCMTGSNEFTASTMKGGNALSAGGYLGGVGPSADKVAALPEGVAYRLQKGQGVMLNLHYINTSDEPVDGDAYIDLKLADADPARLIAAIFINLNGSFSLPPNAPTDSTQDCVAKSDVNIIMMSNHMHEWGTHASTQVIRADTGAVEMLHEDPAWTADMVNAPTFSRWTTDSPFVLHTGDTIRTNCSWENTTTDVLSFPREMCIGVGFALASGDNPKAPACFSGTWIAQGI